MKIMTSWALPSGFPASLVISADSRLTNTDYCNDHSWEISLRGGEPPAVAAQTTYGLRARSMRLFPIFSEGTVSLSDPAAFAAPPHVLQAYPNYAAIGFSPFQDIDVFADYWVPTSQSLAGSFQVCNQGDQERSIRFELTAQLIPMGDGYAMAPQQIQVASILQGKTEKLTPVLFLTGAPEAGPGAYPSLSVQMKMAPGASRRLSWALVTLGDLQASFEQARRLTARPWEAELARVELQNRHDQVIIHSGSPAWDTAFSLSQRQALRLCLSGSPDLPERSFVLTRYPDQGCSTHGGNDYTYSWNGQSAFDALYLYNALPGAAGLAKGWVRNFFATQSEDGKVDWRPGLAGQRSHLLAQPVIAALVWRIYQNTGDRHFLQETFQPLYRFIWSWFTREHDRDGDGIPEWDNPLQVGLDEMPLFDRTHPWGRGLEINTTESPALESLLYQECSCLINIANVLEKPEPVPGLKALAEHLHAAIQNSWDADRAAFFYRDRDTHLTPPHRDIQIWSGPGQHPLNLTLDIPQRLVIHMRTIAGIPALKSSVTIIGQTPQGAIVEPLVVKSTRWNRGEIYLTTEAVYIQIQSILVDGIGSEDQVDVAAVGLDQEDISLMLPLWAQVANPIQAEALLNHSLLNPDRYGHAYGLPSFPGLASGQAVHLPWNALITEGLLAYGYRSQAAELFSHWMEAALQSIEEQRAFRGAYDPGTGEGLGERDILQGLLPVGTFLELLGVRFLPPRQVFLRENNPFPWPVTVQYQGIKIIRDTALTQITFADGQQVTVGPGDHVIALE